jgi:hypothetical protein
MRLNILGDDEIEALFGLPRFTHDERVQYFTLAPTETAVLEQLRSVASRIYFILQLGYFKARRMFFVFSLPEVEEDARYIQEQYFPNFLLTTLAITKTTRCNPCKSLPEVIRIKISCKSGCKNIEATL